ncbi:MAG: type III-B CRISPR module RAMP protein Cmr4 [Symploca sp. SIO1C4]|uniref:Type III-B CRISPR module RAMP protein Cmr4 n=1 Tax=Symploca sp. SIO1C4 TaxID=2607765 RepID=A0A6B3NA80_9CYAN|nr:type III-B CRISPR module RAMP protein Cmr4 [Symploca sp. SIO1C4]
MYKKAYGIIETKAPLHVGATAGEETGNLNLIFRDQFTQTGIIPGSSIRGRFRADMRHTDKDFANECYGHEAEPGKPHSTTEALVKFEYASLLWLPVFCPGQPVVYITCQRLLRRYYQITKKASPELPNPNEVELEKHRNVLFFNLGFLRKLKSVETLSQWLPDGLDYPPTNLVVVDDKYMGIIQDMALYRQSRVRLKDNEKIVDGQGFFNVEALPEGSILVFPIAVKSSQENWTTYLESTEWHNSSGSFSKEMYFGGLESIGFGRCKVTLSGQYIQGEN